MLAKTSEIRTFERSAVLSDFRHKFLSEIRTNRSDFSRSNRLTTEQRGPVRNPNVFGFRTFTVFAFIFQDEEGKKAYIEETKNTT